MIRIYIAIFIMLFSGLRVSAADAEKLGIRTESKTHDFSVEVADSKEELAKGLMHRTELPEKSGMLFDFGTPRFVAMWMKDTLIPLDMLFINMSGKIIHIAHDVTPHSLTPITTDSPVLAVLELPAGTALRFEIKEGDHIIHRLFDKESHD